MLSSDKKPSALDRARIGIAARVIGAMCLATLLLAGCDRGEGATGDLGVPASGGEVTDMAPDTPVTDSTSETDGAPTSAATVVLDRAALVAQLEAQGHAVEPSGTVEQPFFTVDAEAIQVDGAQVQVFEFDNVTERQAASDQITPDGQPSPTTMVTWTDTPHLWAAGRLIVLYVGSDHGVVSALTGILGAPVTTS